jgi:MazG family protein
MTNAGAEFTRLVEIMATLRSPEGCPWDREQTLESMTPYLTEEAAESVDAIARADSDHTVEELGDLLFLALFCLELAEERWGTGVAGALDRASEKLIRRHPHVYGGRKVEDGEAAYRQWQEIKKAEKPGEPDASLLGDQPKGLPALVAAYRLQEKAAAVGFDWPAAEGAFEKVREETAEVERAMRGRDTSSELARELGDLLFAVVNLSRKLGVDPERELRATMNRFRERFVHIERRLAESGRTPLQSNLEEMDRLWDEAKRVAKPTGGTP